MKRSLRSGSQPETAEEAQAPRRQRHTKSVTEGPKTSAKSSVSGLHQKRTKKGTRVRVWWPPTDEHARTSFSGMYWPAKLVSYRGDHAAKVEYDNGDTDTVDLENVHPCIPPCAFGKEKHPLQEGEFVEVSNNSKTDPAEWVGVVKSVKKRGYTVSYPFHNSKDDEVREGLLRRARVWDPQLDKWLCVQPYQVWDSGEVTSPAELYHCTEQQLFACLAGDRKKIRIVGRRAAQTAPEQSTQEVVAASSDPPKLVEMDSQDTNTADGKEQKPEDVVATSAVERAGTKIPSEWLPAPNLGPDCYIVLSRNPNEEPYIVRVAEMSQEAPQQPAPPLPQQPQQQQAAAPAPRVKKEKAPPGPKKPVGAYFVWSGRNRERVKQELGPDATPADVTRRVAQLWAEVDPDEKRILQEEVKAERERYAEATHTDGPASPPKKARLKKDPDAPKRPRTAYILFALDYRKEADPSLDFATLTTLGAEAWKSISPSLKEQYEAMAAIEKQAYEAAMAVYLEHKHELDKQRPASSVPPSSNVHPKELEQQEEGNRVSAAGRDNVAGSPTDILERLNLDVAKQALKKEKLHPDAYYLLVDAWRHDSPRLEAALRAYRMHVDGQKRPDYKGFLIGIFGLETVRPLMMDSKQP